MEYIMHYNINLPEVHQIPYGWKYEQEQEDVTGKYTRLLGNSMHIKLLVCLSQYIIHIVYYIRA